MRGKRLEGERGWTLVEMTAFTEDATYRSANVDQPLNCDVSPRPRIKFRALKGAELYSCHLVCRTRSTPCRLCNGWESPICPPTPEGNPGRTRGWFPRVATCKSQSPISRSTWFPNASKAQTLEICLRLGVQCVTVFAFAIPNFKRSAKEVDDLMHLAEEKLIELCQHE